MPLLSKPNAATTPPTARKTAPLISVLATTGSSSTQMPPVKAISALLVPSIPPLMLATAMTPSPSMSVPTIRNPKIKEVAVGQVDMTTIGKVRGATHTSGQGDIATEVVTTGTEAAATHTGTVIRMTTSIRMLAAEGILANKAGAGAREVADLHEEYQDPKLNWGMAETT